MITQIQQTADITEREASSLTQRTALALIVQWGDNQCEQIPRRQAIRLIREFQDFEEDAS